MTIVHVEENRRAAEPERQGGRGRPRVFRTVLSVFAIVPLSMLLLTELLVAVNEKLIGEEANYFLDSDFKASLHGRTFSQIGPPTPDISPVDKEAADREIYYRYLVELFAPVIFHKVSNHPEWDIPVFIDYDGNMNPRDNLTNSASLRPRLAGVYGEVTAETRDSYYLTYSLYHLKDYDHPVREKLFRSTYHDGDNEGYHIRVDKSTMSVAAAETWFHNTFLLYNRTGISEGTEPVQGPIYFEKDTHPLVYAQPQGHGVRMVQYSDLEALEENVKVMRFVGGGADVPFRADRSYQDDVTYQLRNFDRWYAQAAGPFHHDRDRDGTSLFTRTIKIGSYEDGTPIEIGRFIAGRRYRIKGWARPKPMWSWDDGWDDLHNVAWHFFPSLSFESHEGVTLSRIYTYNRPIEKIFGRTLKEMMPYLNISEKAKRKLDKSRHFRLHEEKVSRGMYWKAAWRIFKRYVNYVFGALG